LTNAKGAAREAPGSLALLLGPLLSGALLVIAFPPWSLSGVGWAALVPLLLSSRFLGPGLSFLLGWAGGVVFFVGFFPWIREVQSATLPAVTAGYLYLGLYFGLFGACVHWISRRLGWPLMAAAPVWVAVEFLRSKFFFLAFPFALLGHSQYENLPIIQVATYTGVYGVSFLMVLVTGALADFVAAWMEKGKPGESGSGAFFRNALICLAVLVGTGGVWIAGHRSMLTPMDGPRLAVSVVQGNIAQKKKWDRTYRGEILASYERLSEKAASDNPRLIVWPETATPGLVLKDAELYRQMVSMVRRIHRFFLIGSAEYPKFGQARVERGRSGNTALFFSPDGKILGQYLKIRLIPFGEYMPLKGIIPWPVFIVRSDKKDGLIPGTESSVFDLGAGRFGTLICWENAFPELTRRLVERGADFVVNISNEAWFGRTAAPRQILTFCVFRAVESRVHMVRATNTGISCFIDPFGRISGRVHHGTEELFVEGVSTEEIRLGKTGSFYQRHGDLFAWICVCAVCFLLLGALFEWRSDR